MAQSPDFFERLVVQLLLKMGYGGPFEDAGIVTCSTGDGGIDSIIKEDKLGFNQISAIWICGIPFWRSPRLF